MKKKNVRRSVSNSARWLIETSVGIPVYHSVDTSVYFHALKTLTDPIDSSVFRFAHKVIPEYIWDDAQNEIRSSYESN